VAAVSAAAVCANAGGTPAATVKKSATADCELGKKGRGVREKAPLQDQLSKRMSARRTRLLCIRRELLTRCYSTPARPAHFRSPN